LRGIKAIVNHENIKPGLDLAELERQLIEGGLVDRKVADPKDKWDKELNEVTKRLGINFSNNKNDESDDEARGVNYDEPDRTASDLPEAPVTRGGKYDDPGWAEPRVARNESGIKWDDTPSADGKETSRSEWDDAPSTETKWGKGEKFEWDGAPSTETKWGKEASRSEWDDAPSTETKWGKGEKFEWGAQDTKKTIIDHSPIARLDYDSDTDYRSSELGSLTREQKNRSTIDSVLGTTNSNNSFSLEKEKREDEKTIMLSEIDELRSVLEQGDIDISRVVLVDERSDYAEVEAVLRMLRHKNDRGRYCSFADEVVLFGAHALEELFDGKRTYFGRYKPDLTGWHNNVNTKLRRMRHDTGQIVGDVMRDYNIGPGMRILLELLPNMVLYSKMRRQQHSQPSLDISDAEHRANIQRINDI